MNTLSKEIINWYEKNKRQLPWRPIDGKRVDPYHVFISEFMLQQTIVKTVIPYFNKFIKKYPTILDLSNADLNEIMSDWSGLGYYRRAKSMYDSAKIIVKMHGGNIPKEKKKLLDLPGIGDYTASAILTIGFNIAENVVDGNIERIFCRLYKISEPIKNVKKKIRNISIKYVPNKNASSYVQGLMDLGSTICKPKITHCNICPISAFCKVSHSKHSIYYPAKDKKNVKNFRTGYFIFFLKKDMILFVKNSDKGLYANMDVLPSYGWFGQNKENDRRFSKFKKIGKKISPNIFHSFSHFELCAKPIKIDQKDFDFDLIDFQHSFVKISELKKMAIPKLHLKIIETILKFDK